MAQQIASKLPANCQQIANSSFQSLDRFLPDP